MYLTYCPINSDTDGKTRAADGNTLAIKMVPAYANELITSGRIDSTTLCGMKQYGTQQTGVGTAYPGGTTVSTASMFGRSKRGS
jgi:hypothetical protein